MRINYNRITELELDCTCVGISDSKYCFKGEIV